MSKKNRNSFNHNASRFNQPDPWWDGAPPELQPFPTDIITPDEMAAARRHARQSPKMTPEQMRKIDVLHRHAQRLIADAKAVEPVLKQIIAPFVKSHTSDLLLQSTSSDRLVNFFKAGPTKSETRLLEKGASYDFDLANVRDIARCEMAGTTHDEIAALCAILEDFKLRKTRLNGNAYVSYIENRFQAPTPTGYRSFQAFVAIPVPGADRFHVAEIMVRHRQFEQLIETNKNNRLGAGSHELYQRIRFMEERYQNEEMPNDMALELVKNRRKITTLHRECAEACGLDKKPDFDRFLKGLRYGWKGNKPNDPPPPSVPGAEP